MKGIVFNLLEDVVSRHHGAALWEDLIDAAGVDGAYTSLGSYPDSDLEALVAAAAAALGTDRAGALRWFGVHAMPVLAERYPGFFAPHATARPFVLGVNDLIHAEVRKLYPGAACPHFRLADADDGDLMMDYRSERRMCALAQGFVEGAAAHYGEAVDFAHVACVDRGDPHCLFRIRWMAVGQTAAA